MRDYYAILGIERSASVDQIKRAYRNLAKKHHPDRNPNDPSAEVKFKEVQQAYATLSDPQKRKEYDQFGEAGVGRWQTNPRGQKVYEWGGNSSIHVEDLEDLLSAFGGGQRPSVFEQFLGGRGRGRDAARSARRGSDEEREVTLTFDQAVHGATLTLQLRKGGNGHVETLDVRIPPGVEDGQKIRLKGKGQPGGGNGAAGDLLLMCRVLTHPHFERRGVDLYLDLPVSVPEAVLGAKIEVPSLEGRATLTLPPGTRSGAKLRLKGCGLKHPGSAERGDQFIIVQIIPPDTLTADQRRLYEELRAQERSDPRAGRGWWKKP